MAPSKRQAEEHFQQLQGTLDKLGLVEAKHKASPPSQHMTWLGLDFDSVNMTITIHQSKLAQIATLVSEWQGMSHANIQQLRVLLGTLLNIT